jgi:hypothetical protein
MDSRNDEQCRSRFFSLEMVDGEFLPCPLEVSLGLSFRDRQVFFSSEAGKPEAENRECQKG